MDFRGIARRLAAAGAVAGFAATLLVGGAAGAQAAAPTIEIVNANSGKNTCMTLTHIAADQKGQVRTQNCIKSGSQKWVVAGGIIRNPTFEQCLESNGYDIFTRPCDGHPLQQWTTTTGDKKWIMHEHSEIYANSTGNHNEEVVYAVVREDANRWYFRTW